MSEKVKSWNEVWTENYLGQSEVAKSITTKVNYKNNMYIPWAVMERALYTLDQDGQVIVLRNDKGMVWTDSMTIDVPQKDGSVVPQTMLAHFVRVTVSFMNKWFEETFPIQNNSYEPVRFYDQNTVNKAIQRAKAKGISRATGIGWALYESGDLQYELDGAAVTTPTVTQKSLAQTTPKETPKAEAEAEATVAVDYGQEVYSIIHDAGIQKEEVQKMLDFVNKSLQRTYGQSLSVDQTVEEVSALISKLAKPEVLVKSIKTQLGVSNA